MKHFKTSFIIYFISILLLLSSCSDKNINSSDNINDNDDTPIIKKDKIFSNESIKEFEQNVLGALTGENEIVPGIKLTERYTVNSRVLARQYLFNVFEELEFTAKRHRYDTYSENIYAILEATEESEEYIVVGAHYDSAEDCPGADDNASGVALVMATARSIEGIANRSKNLIFVLFDQEEDGGFGSQYFSRKLINDKTIIHSMHNFDMLGWDDDGDRAVEIGMPYNGAVELYEEASDSTGMGIPIQPTGNGGSDHFMFEIAGFKVVGMMEELENNDRTPHYHRPTDTYDKINFDYLLSSTLLVIEVMKLLVK